MLGMNKFKEWPSETCSLSWFRIPFRLRHGKMLWFHHILMRDWSLWQINELVNENLTGTGSQSALEMYIGHILEFPLVHLNIFELDKDQINFQWPGWKAKKRQKDRFQKALQIDKVLTKEGKEGRHWLSLHFLHFHLSLQRLGVCSFRIISYHFVSFRIMSLCRWGRRPDHGTRASPSRVTCQKPKYRPGWAQAQVRRRSKIVWRDHSTARFFCPLHSTRHGTRSKINSKNLPSASLFKDSKLCVFETVWFAYLPCLEAWTK